MKDASLRNRNVQWQALPGSAVLEALETSKSSGLTQAKVRFQLTIEKQKHG